MKVKLTFPLESVPKKGLCIMRMKGGIWLYCIWRWCFVRYARRGEGKRGGGGGEESMTWLFQPWAKFNILMSFERFGYTVCKEINRAKILFCKLCSYAVGLSRSINLILMIIVSINNRLPPGNFYTIYATCDIYSGQTWAKHCTFGKRQSF